MLTDEEMMERMEKGWRGGLPDGTVCGIGSTMANTENVREWLPRIVAKYRINSLNDAGAGDRHWIDTIRWHNEMRMLCCFDLIPRRADVLKLDITKDTMPPADAILCRHVLNHLDPTRIGMALQRFRECAPYLIATQFDRFDGSKEFTRVDLRSWLGNPIEWTHDGGAEGCLLAIWSL